MGCIAFYGFVIFLPHRQFGEFTRSFVLPDNVNTESIDAEFKDGLLKVVLEKKEPAKPKELEVSIK